MWGRVEWGGKGILRDFFEYVEHPISGKLRISFPMIKFLLQDQKQT